MALFLEYQLLSKEIIVNPKLLASCLLASTFALSTITLACSNVEVYGPNHIDAVGRTMDLELNTGNQFGFGARGWHNIANINMPQKEPIDPMKWVNKYAFVGQTMFHKYILTDGLNSQGLYAGWLDLPDVSLYPTYNPQDKRPEMGLADLTNYVLGTSKNVPEAIHNIAKTQVIMDTLAVKLGTHTLFGGSAIHLVLRDRDGNSATIEWTKYDGKPKMHIYEHKGGTNSVVESIPDTNAKPVIFEDATGSVTTNAPNYSWQLQNTARFDKVFTGNTNRKWDNLYMNGSGMAGIPGSWTPPSRFARATQLIRLMPKPQTEQQALALAYSALLTIRVPVGANPAGSLWATMSDLKNSVYYFKVLLNAAADFKTRIIKISLPSFNNNWQRIDVKKLASRNRVPKGWVKALVKQGPIATPAGVALTKKMTYAPTPGNIKTTYNWMK